MIMKEVRIIIDAVCKACSLRESQLLSSSRLLPLVLARMIVVLLLERRSYTDERIGWLLNRTRATITVMRHKAHDELESNPAFRRRYEIIKNDVDNATSI